MGTFNFELSEVERLSMKPGDVLVLTVPHHISCETSDRLRTYVEDAVPGHRVLVLSEGLTIKVAENIA